MFRVAEGCLSNADWRGIMAALGHHRETTPDVDVEEVDAMAVRIADALPDRLSGMLSATYNGAIESARAVAAAEVADRVTVGPSELRAWARQSQLQAERDRCPGVAERIQPYIDLLTDWPAGCTVGLVPITVTVPAPTLGPAATSSEG